MSIETPDVSGTSNWNSAEAEHFQDLPCLFSCISAVMVTDAKSLQDLYQATTEVFMMSRKHPSSSANGTEISFLCLTGWSLLLWWYITGVHVLGVLAVLLLPPKQYFPGQNSIYQDWTGSAAKEAHTLFSIDMNTILWEQTGTFSV